MMLIGLLAGLLVLMALGRGILAFFPGDKSLTLPENLAVSFLVGLGGVSLLAFWLSLANVPHKIAIISLFALALFALRWRPRLADGWQQIKGSFSSALKLDIRSLALLLIFLLIALKMTYVFVEASSKPEYSWDACAHWTYPGKVIYDLDSRGVGNIPELLTRFPGHTSHYPKLIPYAHYWLFSWMGEANDQWSKIIFPLSLLAFIVLLYAALRRQRGALEAQFFVWLLLSAPLFLYHATIGYADLTSSLYFSAGIIMFYRWIREKRDIYFFLFTIFIALTTWIKGEGLPFYLIGLALLLIYCWSEHHCSVKERIVRVVQYFAGYAVIGLPWQLLLMFRQVRSTWLFEPHYGEFAKLATDFYANLFVDGSWGVFWFIAIAALLLFPQDLAKKENKYIMLALLFFHLIMIAVYLSFDIFIMSGAAINRQWLNIYPVVVFYLGLIVPPFKQLWPGGSGRDQSTIR